MTYDKAFYLTMYEMTTRVYEMTFVIVSSNNNKH